MQSLGDAYSLGGLEVLEQSGHDARQSQGRAIERMAKLYLLVGVPVTALQAIGLIAVEIGDGADLEPTLLCLAVNLEVIADGRREAHVAAAQAQYAIRQLEFLQQSLHMGQHFLMRLLGVFGGIDTHDLNFGEFMQAIQSAHILTITACLTTEALRIGTILNRQILLLKDDIAIDIGNGNLGRRDEIEIILVAIVHLSFLVGQLTGTVSGSGVDHRRRHYFRVAGSTGFVKEEVDKRTLQTRSLSDIDGEAGTGNLDAEIEVDKIILLGQFPMRQGVFRQLGVMSAGLDHDIIVSTGAFGHKIVGNIGDGIEQLGALLERLLHGLLEFLGLYLDFRHLVLRGFHLGRRAVFHQAADTFRYHFRFRQQAVQFGLGGLALIVNGEYLFHDRTCTREMFLLQTADHRVLIVRKLFDSQHILYINYIVPAKVSIYFENLVFLYSCIETNASRPMTNLIINDPVYGFVSIPRGLLCDIIAHPYFQRLDRIRQLGLASVVYPSAKHTRKQHSIGALHLVQNALRTLTEKGYFIFDSEIEATEAAMLMHDLGHGPFSHVLENTFIKGITHEDLSLMMMEAVNADLHGQLSLAIRIFKDEYPKPFLHELICSQLDMDRLDYLCRDSFYTGVREGSIGAARLIKMLELSEERLAVNAKGIYTVENYLMSRRLMYWQVYLHKTAIAAEEVLRSILRRAKRLAAEGRDLFCSPALRTFLYNDITADDFTRHPSLLDTYATLDDADILCAIKVWQQADDRILARLADGFINRRLLKAEILNAPVSDERLEELKEQTARQMGIAPEDAGYFVTTKRVAKEMYSSTAEGIGIICPDGEVRDLSRLSHIISSETMGSGDCKYFIFSPREE